MEMLALATHKLLRIQVQVAVAPARAEQQAVQATKAGAVMAD
jgi:hypothetical protein